MAIKEHLEKLEEGIEIWNIWREENPEIKTDISNTDLKNKELKHANFEGTDFFGSDLSESKLSESNFAKADFRNSIFKNSDIYNSSFNEAKLTKASISKVKFYKVSAVNTDFSESELADIFISESCFKGAKFNGSKISGLIAESNFNDTVFNSADIGHTEFIDNHLNNASFFSAVVDGYTKIGLCRINKKTDFRVVGIDNIRIDAGTKSLLKHNIKLLNWEEWYKKQNKLVSFFVKLFWWISGYGASTTRLIGIFFISSFIFTLVYIIFPETIQGLYPTYPCMNETVGISNGILFLRAFYFSIVTMTTLGFGDMSAAPYSILGYFMLISQVLLGYVLLGALITRLAILFTAEGPAGKYSDIDYNTNDRIYGEDIK